MPGPLQEGIVDRIGLGGYLSLTEPFPAFQDAVADMADQHRAIRDLHLAGEPAVEPVTVGVITSWGALRTWTASTDDATRSLLVASGWATDGAHRELESADGRRLKQVRLHTSIGGAGA